MLGRINASQLSRVHLSGMHVKMETKCHFAGKPRSFTTHRSTERHLENIGGLFGAVLGFSSLVRSNLKEHEKMIAAIPATIAGELTGKAVCSIVRHIPNAMTGPGAGILVPLIVSTSILATLVQAIIKKASTTIRKNLDGIPEKQIKNSPT